MALSTKTSPKFKGYVKKYDLKKKKVKPTYLGVTFSNKVYSMTKELEDPEKKGLRSSSGLKVHRDATDKLRAENFDPLEQLISFLAEIEKQISDELVSGSPRSSYLADLAALKMRILESLLPYRYGKAPTVTIEQVDIREPIRIVLEENDSKSSPESTRPSKD